MPLPTPRSGEARGDFIGRCVGSDVVQHDYDTQDQRLAVCYSQWERSKEMPEGTVPRKSVKLSGLKLLGDQGSFTGVFATLNVVDHDGDLTLPGAFGQQDVILSQYNHGSWGSGAGALPIGVGKIYEQGDNAIIEGEFNMDSEDAVKTWGTMKFLHEKGRVQEFSYALPEIDFEIREQDGQRIRVLKRIKVPEVSPVLMGAGMGTRLLSIKGISAQDELKRAFGTHSTATSDKPWSVGANEKNVLKDKDRAYYGTIYAYYDPNGETGNKGTYKFIHHFVGSSGKGGAASTRACSNGIGVLNGGRGGADVPNADRAGIHRHLAKHLKDAGLDVPELRSLDASPRTLKLADHLDMLLVEMDDMIERIRDIKAIRESQGRELKEATIERLRTHIERIKSVGASLEELIVVAPDVAADLTAELLRFEQIKLEMGR